MVSRGSALFCYRSDLPLGCWCGKVRSGGPQSSACVVGKGSVFPGPPGCLGRCSVGLRLDQGGRWRTWRPNGTNHRFRYISKHYASAVFFFMFHNCRILQLSFLSRKTCDRDCGTGICFLSHIQFRSRDWVQQTPDLT